MAVRLTIGALFLASILRLSGQPLLPSRQDIPRCVFLGVLLAAHLSIQAFGLKYTTIINTGWIIGVIPVTIAVGAQITGQQRLNPRGWIGVAVATFGILLVTTTELPDFRQARFGDLLQFGSCLTWTVYTLAGAAPVERNGALRVIAFVMVVAAIVAGLAAAGTTTMCGPLNKEVVISMFFLGLACSGLAYVFWFQAIRRSGPTAVGTVLYLEPFITLAAGVLILSEPAPARTLAGGLFVLFGIRFVGKGVRRTVRT